MLGRDRGRLGAMVQPAAQSLKAPAAPRQHPCRPSASRTLSAIPASSLLALLLALGYRCDSDLFRCLCALS